jgi:PHD/YefM family antitoxin component YafN of YafNO toxin-antitoxin module
MKDDLSKFLREAKRRPVFITRHGKPTGAIIGFESEFATGSAPAPCGSSG